LKLKGVALAVKGLTKRFGGVHAVDCVSLDVKEGECHALIGPNGAGKTTLFNLITGEVPLDRGRIFLFGRDITRVPIRLRVALGLARTYQIASVFESCTVEENLVLAFHNIRQSAFDVLLPWRSQKALLNQVLSLAESVGLDLDESVSNLSYGEKRKVEIALALATNPKVLLLDEPTAGLPIADRQSIGKMLVEMISEFGLSILIIEHDTGFVLELADTLTVMDKGSIKFQGEPSELHANRTILELYFGRSTT